MSIQLSLFWKTAEDLTWHWQEESQLYNGTLDELIDQKQQKNLATVSVRLFLPESWFSILNIKLPPKLKRITDSVLRFASEEYLAQDIDTVHLVLLTKPSQGEAAVLVTDQERFKQTISTLTPRGFSVLEAYDSGWYSIPENQTEDILIVVGENHITLRSGYDVYRVHSKGFSQLFDLWREKHLNEESSSIQVVSQHSDGVAKTLVTELEAEGHSVSWVVQEENELPDWNDQAASQKGFGNLITSEYSQGKNKNYFGLWVPSVGALFLIFILWVALIISANIQTNEKLIQTWSANENIFLQVFGKSKKIQRPLMVREMRQATLNTGTEETQESFNAISVLNDLNVADSVLVLESFRFNRERREAFFIVFQSTDAQGDAYNRFELLKTQLVANGYTVKNTAKKDRDGFRAQFTTVKKGTL